MTKKKPIVDTQKKKKGIKIYNCNKIINSQEKTAGEEETTEPQNNQKTRWQQ